MRLKRLFDLVVAVLALVILSPLFVAIAVAVVLDSRGPIFYRARRIGQGGQPFHMFKFRTMVAGADRSGPGLTYNGDPRITRVGRLLRRVRLDELPQLLNVVHGSMSIVGPRPEAPEYVQLDAPIWRQVLSVRPGICGLAQLAFAVEEAALLSNSATVDQDYLTQILPSKLQLDLRYIQVRSLLFDLKLLFQTALLLIRQRRPVSMSECHRNDAAPRRALSKNR
jgi:lipopolysaccharide/colanic/teichoic acid biosynthesis glycosyltransferase